MLIWIVILIIGLSAITLNIFATQTVLSSSIHTKIKRRNYILLIWSIPIVGVILAVLFINRDIKKNKETIESDIADVMKDLAKRINGIEADIKQKRSKKSLH
ncbi:MAG: hypothetical protein GXP08_18250 [Gammaproteobacteria bacterium]|nr:hypothetical protein [Gammaproteobacteria bacterium]